MKICILNVGRVRQKCIVEGEAEYLQRLAPDLKVEVRDLALDAPASLTPGQVRKQEALKTLQAMEQFDAVVLLDERGKMLTTDEFKGLLQGHMQRGTKRLCFLIGGAFGVDESVRQSADYTLSLSSFTLPHQLARLVLVEQIYRAQTMWRGIAYHKGG